VARILHGHEVRHLVGPDKKEERDADARRYRWEIDTVYPGSLLCHDEELGRTIAMSDTPRQIANIMPAFREMLIVILVDDRAAITFQADLKKPFDFLN
jgi:hypothetical protein